MRLVTNGPKYSFDILPRVNKEFQVLCRWLGKQMYVLGTLQCTTVGIIFSK